MSDLRARATAAKTGQSAGNGRSDPDRIGPAPVPTLVEVGPDPEIVPADVAWARVMRVCKALSKGSIAKVVTAKGSYTYNYRGVDDVSSMVGAALRLFGVKMVPIKVEPTYRPVGQMNVCTGIVTYEVSTAKGEGTFQIVVAAEGVDSGDKATIKMMQQAMRVAYIQGLTLPTYDPTSDSDADPVQRPEPPSPMEVRDEILNPQTSVQRLRAIAGELRRDPELQSAKVDVNDRQISLWDLCTQEGKARAETPGAS